MTINIPLESSSELTLPILRRAKLDPTVCILPLLQYPIPAGFPSPAGNYAAKRLDINDYLVRNKASTYFLQSGR